MNSTFLTSMGARLRRQREALGLTRQDVARRSGISLRYLAAVEAGKGNISVGRLVELCEALDLSLDELFGFAARQQRPVVALLGMRGAGKSTVGHRLALRMQCAFHELDELVERGAGLSLAEVFELHGESYYRQLEATQLDFVLRGASRAQKRVVLATGGGIVASPSAFQRLLHETTTVWLQADPAEHISRVQAQGDRRPFENRPHAEAELRAILDARRPLYELADLTVDTTGRPVDTVVDYIAFRVESARRTKDEPRREV